MKINLFSFIQTINFSIKGKFEIIISYQFLFNIHTLKKVRRRLCFVQNIIFIIKNSQNDGQNIYLNFKELHRVQKTYNKCTCILT